MENKKNQESEAKACGIQGCRRPYRAKGYCGVHYKQWRKGKLPKARYNTCHFGVNTLHRGEKKECLKPVFRRGLCEQHFKAKFDKKQAERPVPDEA